MSIIQIVVTGFGGYRLDLAVLVDRDVKGAVVLRDGGEEEEDCDDEENAEILASSMGGGEE